MLMWSLIMTLLSTSYVRAGPGNDSRGLIQLLLQSPLRRELLVPFYR